MPKKLQKTLQDYLNKLKNKNPHPQIQLQKMLSGCKHPKTPSFSLENGRNGKSSNTVNNNNKIDDAATLADVDRFLFENFKSLYFKDDEETEQHINNNNNNKNKRITNGSNEQEPVRLGSYLFETPRFITTPPQDLSGSTRFFVKPGISGSLMEDVLSLTNSDEGDSSNSNSSSTESPSKEVIMINDDHVHNHTLPENCVALLTYSPNPYDDFRRSMQDVVESKYGKIDNNERKIIDWDFMEEVLFCYLNVNEKKSHKFILSAFVDLITVMRRNSEAAPAKPCSVRTVRIGREVMRKKKTKQVTIQFGS